MSWPRFSISHRYTIFSALIAVVILGVAARFSIPVRLFPDTDPPVVTVITPYPGVAAVDVGKNLSKPMEEEFGGIDGVVRVNSTSQMGLSVVKVEFGYQRRVEEAAVDVQNAISRIRDKLPEGIREPQVMQFSSADKPILTIAVTSSSFPLAKVRDLADNPVRDRLQLVSGVAAVDVFGGHRRQLEVAVHADRLRAFGVTMAQAAGVLEGWNLTESGGRVNVGALETVVRFDAPLSSPDEVAKIVLLRRGDMVVHLSDVADVSETVKEQRSAYHFNGKPAIAVQVFKRDEANTIKVASAVRETLSRIEQDFPYLQFAIADDDSQFTELVINNMTSSVLIAIILTIIVVFLFMAHLRQAAIIAISIPVSFLLTFMLMWAFGIDLNMITMSAIILSIGLLVDDGIVVIENIHRHLMLPGNTPFKAAVEGTEEIFLADLAGTVTTISVLVPLIFLGGFVGKMFTPLAWTLSFALASSFLVSVTLIPLLAALWLRPQDDKKNLLTLLVSPFTLLMKALKEGYLSILRWALRHPWLTLGGALMVLVLSVRIMVFLGSEMLPRFDSGTFQISLDGIPGTPLEKNLPLVKAVEKKLLSEPEVVGVSTQIGFEPGAHYLGGRGAMDVHQAQITVNLTPRTERTVTLWEVMGRLRSFMQDLPGVTLGTTKEKGGTARATTAAPIDVRLSGPDPAVLDYLGSEVLERIRAVPGLRDVYKNWALNTPETRVIIDHKRAAELGLTGKAIAKLVYQAMEGWKVTNYRQLRYRDLDVYLRYAPADRQNIDDLSDVVLQGPDGRRVPLREVANLEQHLGPGIVTREDYQQTLDVLGYHYGRPLSETVADVKRSLSDLKLPDGYHLDITGEQRDFQEARTRMVRALALGILAVYLVLVAQFRSFKHPFTIMAAVPLQFVGVAAGLLVAGKYLSMPAMLGIILLTGTVVNNSIVLIDYILRRRQEGMELAAAIMESVSVRYRPIMMTALSDVAGMLPLALEMAVGSERFSPLATAVIGGVLAATLLTLVVIPVIFRLLER
ncbi:MAG: efflux RND transporter permease subunit [Deltaproteobacteria bacterium]|nr:efflux RND transporter permease subunit [Deltaproteobacteria bacterium]